MGSDPFIGRTIGTYRIEEKIGEGGMGAIYRALHTTLDREVALKILPERIYEENPVFVERFLVEARAAAKLNHPNIVQVYDAGETEGLYFIAMEFVRGLNLRELHERKGSFSERQAVDIALQAARGLETAWASKIIHRDIKPDNIMITMKGQVKVADFGLAKHTEASANLTQAGQVLGTPAYMSPEQGIGEGVDFRSDIYSLGVTLFELATDRQPFQASSAVGLLVMHFNAPLPDPASIKPDLNPALCSIIRKMMEKDSSDRFGSYGELIEALSGLRGESAPAEGEGEVIDLTGLMEWKADHERRKRVHESDTRLVPKMTKPRAVMPEAVAALLPPGTAGGDRKRRLMIWAAAGGGMGFVAFVVLLAILGIFSGSIEPEPGPGEDNDLLQEGTKPFGNGGKNPEAPRTKKARANEKEKKLAEFLKRAEALEKEKQFQKALEVLSKAAAVESETEDSRNAKRLLSAARGRFDLASAREAEKRGDIDEALRLAERAGGRGAFFPRLADYLSRLMGKREILKKFPPGPHWNAERKKEIRLKVFRGSSPTAEEREFYKRFREWERATDPERLGIGSVEPGEEGSGAGKGEEIPQVLKKFPPGKSWNRKRKEKIVVKMISGEDPTPEEKEFYRRFREWEKAAEEAKSRR